MKWLFSIALLILVITGYYLWPQNSQPLSSEKSLSVTPAKNFWQNNNDILIYLEAITRIKDHGLFIKPETTRQDIILSTLKAYVEKLDTYAAYLSADEFSQWQAAQGDSYVGIGMEIEKNKDGQVLCLPYPESPAEQSGIHAGDLLISIEGMPVQGKSILAIGAMARGKQGSSVKLGIIDRTGKAMQINVTRTAVSQVTVTRLNISNIPVIKITAFTRDTKAKLENELSGLNRNQPVIIDLRNNAGGDLSAAIDSSRLFLPEHKTIVSIKTRHGTDLYESDKNAVKTNFPLFIWQDEGTASAAEVFTAALTRNKRATSIGDESFGKGTKQEIFKLSDGSALFLTTGFLQTPDKQFFDGTGLAPDYPIDANTPQTADFIAKVKKLLDTPN